MQSATSDSENLTPVIAVLRFLTRSGSRHPWTTLLLATVLSVACGIYTWTSLEFKTKRADLIDPSADYHQRWINYTQQFGDVADMVVVVEGTDRVAIEQAVEDLGSRLESEPQHFQNVLYKVDFNGLRAKGLQYLSPQQLQMLISRLEEFGPVLQGRWSLFRLRSIFQGLRHQLVKVQEQTDAQTFPVAAEPILQQTVLLSESVARFIANPRDYQSPWLDLMPAGASDRANVDRMQQFLTGGPTYLLNKRGTMGFVKAQPVILQSNFNGADVAITRLRELITLVGHDHANVKLGVTGIPVLENDEMRDSQIEMTWASAISFLGTGLLLVMGFHGLRHPILGMVLLTVGTAWSFGFTTLAVGHLNILSLSFAAMLIGLGIDFAIVYLSHYIDLRHQGHPLQAAVLETSSNVGAGIFTAGMLAAVAFFSAIFTDFIGVAELGLISGGGILLCLVATFWVLPALLAAFDHMQPRELPTPFKGKRLKYFISQYPVTATVLSSIVILGLGYKALDVKYDFNLLNLQAKGLEAVELQDRVFEQSDGSILFAVSLADSPKQALELKKKIEALPTVHHVDELASVWPPHPEVETKLLLQAVQAELAQLPSELPQLSPVDPKTAGEQMQEMYAMLKTIRSRKAARAAASLDGLLDRLNEIPEAEQQAQLLTGFQAAIANDLLARMRFLASMANAEPVDVSDLPRGLASRFVSEKGQWLLQIYPKMQVWDIEPLSEFIKEIRRVDSDVTGTPLQTYEASRAIRRSYQQAAVYALFAVFIILLIDYRSVKQSLLALLPPAAGLVMTFGVLVLMKVDLNPANLILLPLILGIGVDGGVHVVHDFRLQRRRYRTSSSTINAIILTATTSMAGFGSLMVAKHRGLYSLGLVLTVGVTCCLFIALVMIPSILTLISRRQFATRRRDRDRADAERAANPILAENPPHAAVRRSSVAVDW
jgi:hopanoid biosynthesis associated RND transporter like protein HpnN